MRNESFVIMTGDHMLRMARFPGLSWLAGAGFRGAAACWASLWAAALRASSIPSAANWMMTKAGRTRENKSVPGRQPGTTDGPPAGARSPAAGPAGYPRQPPASAVFSGFH
jgi:hypothetical protein